jgi:hypothetical protein
MFAQLSKPKLHKAKVPSSETLIIASKPEWDEVNTNRECNEICFFETTQVATRARKIT